MDEEERLRGSNPRLLNTDGSGLGVVRDDMRERMTADSMDAPCVCDEIERVSSACEAGLVLQ